MTFLRKIVWIFCLSLLVSNQLRADLLCNENNAKLSILGNTTDGHFNAVLENEGGVHALTLVKLEESRPSTTINSIYDVLDESQKNSGVLIADIRLPWCNRNGCRPRYSIMKLLLGQRLWTFNRCILRE